MITSKYPAKFLLFGQPFEYDAIQAWYGYFKVHKLLVSFMETDESSIDYNSTNTNVIFICNIYHIDEHVSVGFGSTPLSAAINAKLHNFIEAVDSMNWFLDEL